MYFKTKVLYFLLLSLFYSGCIKKTLTINDLPPISTTGANTLGCLIDGTGYVPNALYGSSYFQKFYANDPVSKKKKFGLLTSRSLQSPIKTLNITGSGIVFRTGDNIPILPPSTKNSVSAIYYLYGTGLQGALIVGSFKSNASPNNVLNILKLDTVKRILSGTFSFDAVDTLGKIAQIRSGRFDITY